MADLWEDMGIAAVPEKGWRAKGNAMHFLWEGASGACPAGAALPTTGQDPTPAIISSYL